MPTRSPYRLAIRLLSLRCQCGSLWSVATRRRTGDERCAAIDDFEIKILTSTHWAGKRLVPGGEAHATRLGTTDRSSGCHAIFPHVLGETEPEGEGEEAVPGKQYYSIQTDKNTSVRVRLYRKSHRNSGARNVMDENELIEMLNATRTETDEPATTSLQFRMELLFDALDDKNDPIAPVGAGPNKTFERPVINTMTAHRNSSTHKRSLTRARTTRPKCETA